MRIDAVIPFFGGSSVATHSREDTRWDYLQQTLDSLAAYDIRPHIFVSRRDKSDSAARLADRAFRLDIEPEWLPWAACSLAQQSIAPKTDLVYVTEADQILWVADTDVFSIPNSTRYLAPWRLDLVGPNGECELPDGPKYVTRTGKQYSITNGAHRLVAHDAANNPFTVIPQHAQQQAFSGCYFAAPEFFGRIKFRKRRVLPVEHATGFDAKSTGLCVKTSDVERCWVEHLSPLDRHPQPEQEEVK